MRGLRHLGFLAIAAVASGSAVAAETLPEGWHLQVDDFGGAPELILAWYEPGTGDVKAAVSCSEGFADVVLTIYVDAPAAVDAAPVAVVLENEGTRFAFESPIVDYNGFSVGTITRFGPELTALLQSGFSVTLDGVEHQKFDAKSGKGEIDRILAACPAD
ncbi:hypothetical protein VW35_06750 [Devosia soli]|uniref:Uncharacterized protein n=1 Tax=Devosia soli TaxID=361041 RepID=A0A0F5LD67_9HYPH|nr:hypothetical protein [Devosia soli]KKB80129.1 hypothetical protein VW35_06750 [Devosia soli]